MVCVAADPQERIADATTVGLTETSPATHVLPLGKAREKLGSIGQLLPSLQARLTTENGQDAAEGNPGELLLKGPTVMK